MTQTIAFVTDLHGINEDDQLAAQALRAAGMEVTPVRWDDTNVDWAQFTAVVIRSTWDYFHRAGEFSAWFDRLESAGANVWNPLDIVRWNMDKTYLRDLQNDGVRMIPSVWLPQGATVDLADLLHQKGWQQAVIKPVISAAAYDTYTVDASNIGEVQSKLTALLRSGGVLAQEFMAEVQAEGEWSLLFFNKQYSHATLKRPKPGDFRVQMTHGGSTEAGTPPQSLIAQAQAIVDAIEGDLLYARVDGVVRGGEFYLLELELIEPLLFFAYHPDAPSRFASTLAEFISIKER